MVLVLGPHSEFPRSLSLSPILTYHSLPSQIRVLPYLSRSPVTSTCWIPRSIPSPHSIRSIYLSAALDTLFPLKCLLHSAPGHLIILLPPRLLTVRLVCWFLLLLLAASRCSVLGSLPFFIYTLSPVVASTLKCHEYAHGPKFLPPCWISPFETQTGII